MQALTTVSAFLLAFNTKYYFYHKSHNSVLQSGLFYIWKND